MNLQRLYVTCNLVSDVLLTPLQTDRFVLKSKKILLEVYNQCYTAAAYPC